jgi:hypothetical protein
VSESELKLWEGCCSSEGELAAVCMKQHEDTTDYNPSQNDYYPPPLLNRALAPRYIPRATYTRLRTCISDGTSSLHWWWLLLLRLLLLRLLMMCVGVCWCLCCYWSLYCTALLLNCTTAASGKSCCVTAATDPLLLQLLLQAFTPLRVACEQIPALKQCLCVRFVSVFVCAHSDTDDYTDCTCCCTD